MNDHPITPPPELVRQWRNLPEYASQLRAMSMVTITTEKLQDIATQAAQWGADQELEACCEWLHWQNLATHPELIPSLRAARRPKPPSLKEQALELVETYTTPSGRYGTKLTPEQCDTIRRALEQLDD